MELVQQRQIQTSEWQWIPMVRRPAVVVHNAQTSSSLKPLSRSKPNFMWSLFWKGKRKFVRGIWVTCLRWPPCPYMVKTLQKSSSPEPAGGFHEIWYVASGTPAHHSLFKWWPWQWPWPILRQGQIWQLRLFYRKKWKLLIFQNICSLWPETKWKNEHMWVLKVKLISWPWPKVIYIRNLKLAFLKNHWAHQSQILYVSFQVQGNEILSTWCWSHDQDGCHVHIW